MDSIFATPLSEKTERELLLELYEKLEIMEKREKRRSVMGWTIAVLLIIALAAGIFFAVPKYQAFITQYNAVAETVGEVNTVLENIDLEGLTDAANFLAGIDYQKLSELSALLESMDSAKLSEQLEEITSLIDQLGELNTEALVENINLIIEKLQPIMNWFR